MSEAEDIEPTGESGPTSSEPSSVPEQVPITPNLPEFDDYETRSSDPDDADWRAR